MEIDFDAIPSIERYKFLTQVIVPRPIAWVTSIDQAGRVNAAPFSFFNVFGSKPALVALGIGNRSDGTPKDTVLNIQSEGQFVINMATEALAEKMVATSMEVPHGENELQAVGLSTCQSKRVSPPRISESPVNLECELISIQELEGNRLILGKVIHASVDDQFYDNSANRVLTEDLKPIGRMHGPAGYNRTTDYFEIKRPQP